MLENAAVPSLPLQPIGQAIRTSTYVNTNINKVENGYIVRVDGDFSTGYHSMSHVFNNLEEVFAFLKATL